jgi:hypothetical protein
MKKTLLLILLFFPFFALGQVINAAFEKGVWGSDVISTEICPQNNSPSTFHTDSQGKQNILSIRIYQQLLIGILEKPILN